MDFKKRILEHSYSLLRMIQTVINCISQHYRHFYQLSLRSFYLEEGCDRNIILKERRCNRGESCSLIKRKGLDYHLEVHNISLPKGLFPLFSHSSVKGVGVLCLLEL